MALRRTVPALKNEVEAANLKSAEEIAAMARALRAGADRGVGGIAPWSPGRADATPGGRAVPQGAAMVTAGNKKAYYAAMVEFGTERTTAQPYFYPSYRANRKRVKARASRAMSKAIKLSAGK